MYNHKVCSVIFYSYHLFLSYILYLGFHLCNVFVKCTQRGFLTDWAPFFYVVWTYIWCMYVYAYCYMIICSFNIALGLECILLIEIERSLSCSVYVSPSLDTAQQGRQCHCHLSCVIHFKIFYENLSGHGKEKKYHLAWKQVWVSDKKAIWSQKHCLNKFYSNHTSF